MSGPVVVVGGGAAGLMVAIRAAERGRKVVLLERNPKPGVKILMSGGTRCNVTHDGPPDEVLRAFAKPAARFLRPSLLAFTPQNAIAFFEAHGVPLKTEPPHGKVFPRSDRALDVQKALVALARARGAEIRTGARVLAARKTAPGFAVALEGGSELEAGQLVIASGGQSYPGCGTTGDGYAIARSFGHALVPTRPALVPISLARPLEGLSGVSLVDARVGLATKGGKLLATRRGELLFTHRGLSGPTALDLSGELTGRTAGVVRDVPQGSAFEVALDLLPEVSHEELGALLAGGERGRGARPVVSVLVELGLPRRLLEALVALARIPAGRTLQELRRDERTLLVRALKDQRLAASGTLGFEKAEVTAGGVALDGIDPRTLASRLVPGLSFVGEVLDVDGAVGGYNFQAAWSTGHACGSAV